MSAFAFSGHCYASPGEALSAFNQSFPIIGDSNFQYLQSSGITAQGLINYVTNVRPVGNSNGSNITATLALTACSEPDQFDSTVAAGIWFGVFSTVITLYLVSKNAGVILSMIRRF